MTSQCEQREVLEKVAQTIIRRQLCPVAIFTLETMKPLSFLASQALVVLGPIVQAMLPTKQYGVFCDALENRSNVEWLIQRLEQGEDQKLDGAEQDENAQ